MYSCSEKPELLPSRLLAAEFMERADQGEILRDEKKAPYNC